MKFPHDDRLRRWLESLCDALEGHEPSDIAICTVVMDAKTMEFSIRGSHPSVEDQADEAIAIQWLGIARDILNHALVESKDDRPDVPPPPKERSH